MDEGTVAERLIFAGPLSKLRGSSSQDADTILTVKVVLKITGE